jgi:hypothetical protein
MLTARTLAEAHVYASVISAADPPDATASTEEALVEGADTWTLNVRGYEISVAYASQQAARQAGERFGLGVSELVDAGEWVLVATTYARRALDLDLAYDNGPESERRSIELNWMYAADALAEAVKFLPADAAEIPASVLWSELGRQTYQQQPALFQREKLLGDLEYFRGTLDDFRALHGGPSV